MLPENLDPKLVSQRSQAQRSQTSIAEQYIRTHKVDGTLDPAVRVILPAVRGRPFVSMPACPAGWRDSLVGRWGTYVPTLARRVSLEDGVNYISTNANAYTHALGTHWSPVIFRPYPPNWSPWTLSAMACAYRITGNSVPSAQHQSKFEGDQ